MKTTHLSNEEVERNCANSTNPRVRAFLESRRRRRQAMRESKSEQRKTPKNNSTLGLFQGKGHKLGD